MTLPRHDNKWQLVFYSLVLGVRGFLLGSWTLLHKGPERCTMYVLLQTPYNYITKVLLTLFLTVHSEKEVSERCIMVW